MNIAIATSEVAPFSKTGGLADVCGALPRELARRGHNVIVITPAYRSTFDGAQAITPTDVAFEIRLGVKNVHGRLLASRLPESDVPVYLVDQLAYYDRAELYRENGADYPDNCERFVFFSRAVLESLRQLEFRPDVIHVHDWQTGLVPALLKIEHTDDPWFASAASLLTIHNMAYQGRFWHWDMLLTGLDWQYFNWRQMEFHGELNLLKTGIVFADRINTVSPRYAQEIQTPEFGCGLEGALQHRRSHLSGILNGIDTSVWNPAIDPHLAVNYDREHWRTGKAACKAWLQQHLQLPVSAETPLIGLVGRLAEQKGWSLILPVMRHWLESLPAQWVVLGAGEPDYRGALAEMARQFPHKLAVRLEFSEPLAHQIEAGSDMFLMPSLYEPCGLNQLYSLAYGTVPIVRLTGGLADTVVDAGEASLAAQSATGFGFEPPAAAALESALARAVHTYLDKPSVWATIVDTGMGQDWSWERSARQYERLYRSMLPASKHVGAAN
jgi:starch synthase